MSVVMAEKVPWEFARGHEIAPGRTTLKALGGGSRCQVYLVRDEHLGRLLVAKMLRRNLVGDEPALRALAREMDALEELAHAGLPHAVDARLDGPYPHIAIEHVPG